MSGQTCTLTLGATALALPTGANTVTLLDSFVAFSGCARFAAMGGVPRLEFHVKHDQAGTLRLQKSSDGVTYTTVHEQALAGSATEEDAVDWYIGVYEHWKLQWVNGGVDQTVWSPSCALSPEAAPVQA